MRWEHYAHLIDVKRQGLHKAHSELQNLLARAGQDGWELVAIVPVSDSALARGWTEALEIIFKRPAATP